MFWTLDIWKGFKKLSYTVGKRLKKKSMPDTYLAATENERPTLVSYDWYWIGYKEANTGILNILTSLTEWVCCCFLSFYFNFTSRLLSHWVLFLYHFKHCSDIIVSWFGKGIHIKKEREKKQSLPSAMTSIPTPQHTLLKETVVSKGGEANLEELIEVCHF